ncbi:MAG TPA: substrate-binding domain-containing protein [Candidatus Limivivens intestinipullorum]|uniref:Substrate-binding domain-containing protein n=1 Tax=Candidatus Limivivens intestinipullorum TaxID=2840858 RepID=A0A9D1EWC2_9FIRM|nr:substrate-binding domain-containing protein [Candidatus Limivivens intestinipullorum]
MKNNSKKIFILTEAVLAVLVIVTAIAMAGEWNGQKRGRVSVIVRNSDNSQWSAFKYGLRMAAEDLEMEMFVVSTAEQMSVEEQEELIQWEIDNHVDAVIVQPLPGEEAARMLESVGDQIPLMLLEYGIPKEAGENGLPVVGPDHEAMGRALAEELLKDYQGDLQGKTLGILAESEESEAVRNREKGFLDAIEGKGGTVLWSLYEGGETRDQILAGQEETDFVIALDNASLISAGASSSSNDLHGALVYGIGNSTEAVYYLDVGSVECLVVPDEFSMGYESLNEVAEKLSSFSGTMENQTVSYTVIRREMIFTEENQELLFAMNQ